jgi:uncharacterized NAD(P)/FAD-binding protein YdhS
MERRGRNKMAYMTLKERIASLSKRMAAEEKQMEEMQELLKKQEEESRRKKIMKIGEAFLLSYGEHVSVKTAAEFFRKHPHDFAAEENEAIDALESGKPEAGK